MTTPPPVVGLDLSLTAAGLAVDGRTTVVGETGRKTATLLERHARLHRSATTIALHVAEAAAGRRGALVVVEAPAYDSRTGSQHDRSGLWWLVVDELLSAGHLVVEVTTGGLKKFATGKGNANKTAIAVALAVRYGVEFPDDNQADAFVLRAMGLHHLGRPIAAVPKTHTIALEAVSWPSAEQLAELALPSVAAAASWRAATAATLGTDSEPSLGGQLAFEVA